MIAIGLTGNIGSGKSTIAKIFQSFGFDFLDADVMAKELYYIDEIRVRIEKLLGKSILNKDGKVDYKIISEQYFNNAEIYKSLNNILYPALQQKIKKEISNSKKNLIIEAAMLFEIGFCSLYDYIITVSAPIEERIERIKKRNGFSTELFMEREKNQSSASWKEQNSDFVIYNNNGTELIPQVSNILKKIGIELA
ncbi:MAG: dephospho-CoA kinase [Bacteroidales bacterium]|jgi:dephospho-CoA kinase|nr:dephospho-CoA kinase [Bacteroidales bacterium]